MSLKTKLKKALLQKKEKFQKKYKILRHKYDEWFTRNIYLTLTTGGSWMPDKNFTPEDKERIQKKISMLDD